MCGLIRVETIMTNMLEYKSISTGALCMEHSFTLSRSRSKQQQQQRHWGTELVQETCFKQDAWKQIMYNWRKLVCCVHAVLSHVAHIYGAAHDCIIIHGLTRVGELSYRQSRCRLPNSVNEEESNHGQQWHNIRQSRQP